MAKETAREDAVRIQCVCGKEVCLEPQLLGRVVQCPHCRSYLRAALQFLLMDRSRAPNLTAQCVCGHFIVADADKVGKPARCKVCKNHLMMPQPAVRSGVDPVVRVPRKVLESRMARQQVGQRAPAGMVRLQSAAHSGRISLRPGEHICVYPECGALLSARANVCPKCGTNRLTGQVYMGLGPAADPLGRWEEP